MQEEMFMLTVGAYIKGNRKVLENPRAFRMPKVAAPAPARVSGPRKRPRGAMIINTMQIMSVELGITLPSNAWK